MGVESQAKLRHSKLKWYLRRSGDWWEAFQSKVNPATVEDLCESHAEQLRLQEVRRLHLAVGSATTSAASR